MTCNITENLCAKFFYEIKVPRVWDPEKIMIIFDHQILAYALDTAVNGPIIHKFVKYQ
ncbi:MULTISPECIES: hypothetical protein [Methanobacterium]|jgi:3-isopropylmalate/(R)-2-methylmalate dehydratase large subunit|uniref:hypothetical protein n=1 Tax=Methanobacterium TaxID=2160 RepID=UPI0015B6809F|nr:MULTISPECIES: hypothetical protein [Methanobacterium]